MNKKGFVVSAVLYPLLILFLALMMGLLSMSSTRKNILDNMKMEISDSIFDSVTCDCEIINKTLKQYGDDLTNLENKITNIENNYAKKTDLNNYVKNSDLTNILKDYLKKSDLGDLDLSEYAKKSDLNDYVTKSWIQNTIIATLNNYATTETTTILNNKVTDLTNRVNRIEATLNPTIRLKVGDYVYMKPYSTSYTIPATDTGCTGSTYCGSSSLGYVTDQTINPSELTLWRVIRDNGGTYDMVSEYTSSTKVYFYGETGYQKYVGTLQKIAVQYRGKYIISARMMGYNGQTLDGTNYIALSKNRCETSATSDNSKEASGCGDVLYATDVDLVRTTYALDGLTREAGLKAHAVNDETTATSYWLASRYYHYTDSSYYGWYVRYIDTSGYLTYYSMYRYDIRFLSYSISYALRPIVTLNSMYYISSGSGTKDNPYVLN